MASDADLLRKYVEDNAGDAFAEIVRRNAGLVHACVLRRVGGDAQLAEDINQKVFSDLARKAPKLASLTSVAGWLYVSATFASAEVVRKERSLFDTAPLAITSSKSSGSAAERERKKESA